MSVEVNYSSLSSLQSNISALLKRATELDGRVVSMQNELNNLRKDFFFMMKKQNMQFALQRAVTEVIRVRQELERKFGNHELVRQNMLGILDATDLALIHQTTVTSCSEELMLATPKYWLSPCLIALSAWISNDKDLAERAIKEAVRRDDEKTSLVFALICRRNGRTDACFEWLSRYFAQQKASDMKESIIAYIDAYANGVFGEDKDNLCTEYIDYWMKQLQRSNPNFQSEQHEYWKRYFLSFCEDLAPQFKALSFACPEFGAINQYLSRIEVSSVISDEFSRTLSAPVEKRDLIEKIDLELKHLVTEYEDAEKALRKEEEFYSLVKQLDGDEERARHVINVRASIRSDKPVNLAERLSDVISKSDAAAVSAKKTAIRFLSEYIKGAYTEFIDEKQGTFPQEITLEIMDWRGRTTDGSNESELSRSLSDNLQQQRSNALSKVKNTPIIASGICAAIALIMVIVGAIIGGGFWSMFAIGLIALIGSVVFLAMSLTAFTKKRKEINELFERKMTNGPKILSTAIAEWKSVREKVNAFIGDDKHDSLELTEVNTNG